MEGAQSSEQESPMPPTDARKLVVSIPEALLTSLISTCAAKADVSLIGRVHGKHPGLKALTAWARETLHPTLALLSLKANNLFEVTFTAQEGRTHALTQNELTCETASITFSSWRPHFDSKTPQAEDSLDFPIWVQIVDLCQILRDDTFLHTIGGQIGQVVTIDNSEAYRAKLFGPRIRILVKDLHSLPHTVVVPRLDGDGLVEYTLEYNGMPNQCGRCRALDHQARQCPKRDGKFRRKEAFKQKPTNQHRKQNQPHNLPANTHIPPTTDLNKGEPEVDNLAGQGTDLPTEAERPPTPETPPTTPKPGGDNPPAALQPDEINFPRLPSPSPAPSPNPTTQTPLAAAPSFVWRMKSQDTPNTDREKKKGSESIPLTRHGYRTGRLAEDFWVAIGMPNTPTSPRKSLRVIPTLTKNAEQTEHLIDKDQPSPNSIAAIPIAEILAGIPWTTARARQHVVNEVSQALHKLLIFNTSAANPFQKWSQGQWHSQWSTSSTGDHICTLHVIIQAPESKIKIRKSKNLGWSRLPDELHRMINNNSNTDEIQELSGANSSNSIPATISHPPVEITPNPFAALSEEVHSSS